MTKQTLSESVERCLIRVRLLAGLYPVTPALFHRVAREELKKQGEARPPMSLVGPLADAIARTWDYDKLLMMADREDKDR